MLFNQITFVIQGPITPSITSTSVRRLRSIFPGCQIIVSTWEGENTQDIEADLIIYNKIQVQLYLYIVNEMMLYLLI